MAGRGARWWKVSWLTKLGVVARTDKRARLVAAAEAVARRQGFTHASLADIAACADVPVGNVYYWFKTKRELGEALVEQRATRYRALREEWDQTLPPRRRIEAFIDMVIANRDTLAAEGCPIGSLCTELRRHDPALGTQAGSMLSDFLGWLEAQFRALGHDRASAGLARHTLSVLQGASLLSHALGDPAHVAAEAGRLKLWLTGLTPGPGTDTCP
jgi:TetR/AcrR family transcriptional regulator, transcriptional repressor for nem operon